MTQKDSDLHRIKELVEIMKSNNLVEVEIEHGDDKIFIKRSQPQPFSGGIISAVPAVEQSGSIPIHTNQMQSSASGAGSSEMPSQQGLVEIKSPLIGTFYATPSPDSQPYVEVGSQVDEQTVVCIIEAMKVMNEIKAETSGTIAEVLVTNGQAVEYGQVLFRVKPD